MLGYYCPPSKLSSFGCGGEEVVEPGSVSDDAVSSAVSQIVCTVFVSEQRVSWVE